MKYVTKNTWIREDTGEVLGVTYAENMVGDVIPSDNKKAVEEKQKRAVENRMDGGMVKQFRNSYGLLNGLDDDVPIRIGMEAVKLTDEVLEDIHARGQHLMGETEPEGRWMNKNPIRPGTVFAVQHWIREDTGAEFHSNYAQNPLNQIIVFDSPDDAETSIAKGSGEDSMGPAKIFLTPFTFPEDLDPETIVHQEFSITPVTQEGIDAIHAEGKRTTEDIPETPSDLSTLLSLLSGTDSGDWIKDLLL